MLLLNRHNVSHNMGCWAAKRADKQENKKCRVMQKK